MNECLLCVLHYDFYSLFVHIREVKLATLEMVFGGVPMSLSSFFGLNIGVSALDTMQQAEDVVANNISNANTPGYVQETAQLQESSAYPPIPSQDQPIMGGQMGQGVDVSEVTRDTNSFVNEQDRSNQSTYNMYKTYDTNLTQIESILNEPSSDSMQNAVDQFFASWQTLSTDPSNTAARQSVISEAQTLGQTFQTITTQLEGLQSNLVSQIQEQVQELNGYASQVAQLNNQIVQINQMNSAPSAGGQSSQQESPNQLLDQRGHILDEMAQLSNISYNQTGFTGAVSVNIGSGPSLVTLTNGSWTSTTMTISSMTQTSLVTQTSMVTSTNDQLMQSPLTLTNITSGMVAGNTQSLDYTNQLLANLDTFLSSFSNQVNAIQGASGTSTIPVTAYPLIGNTATYLVTGSSSGITYTYGNLFIPTTTTAGNVVLTVNPLFTQNSGTNYISASDQPSSQGNNTIAQQMENLQSQSISITYTQFSSFQFGSSTYTNSSYSQNTTADQYLASIVSNLGIQTAAVQSSESTANSLAQQSSNLRQSISGVDTNDQAAKMVEFQNSYDAAAKFISVYDTMLQSLINMIP